MGRAVSCSAARDGPEQSAAESLAPRSTGPKLRPAAPSRAPPSCSSGREQGKAAKGLGPSTEKTRQRSPVPSTQHVISTQQKMPQIHNGSRQRGRKALTSKRFLVGFKFNFLKEQEQLQLSAWPFSEGVPPATSQIILYPTPTQAGWPGRAFWPQSSLLAPVAGQGGPSAAPV